MYVYIYIYIHTYIHTHIHTYAHMVYIHRYDMYTYQWSTSLDDEGRYGDRRDLQLVISALRGNGVDARRGLEARARTCIALDHRTLTLRRPCEKRAMPSAFVSLFESDTLFLESFCLCRFELSSDSSNRGMSKQYPLTILLESPTLKSAPCPQEMADI